MFLSFHSASRSTAVRSGTGLFRFFPRRVFFFFFTFCWHCPSVGIVRVFFGSDGQSSVSPSFNIILFIAHCIPVSALTDDVRAE